MSEPTFFQNLRKYLEKPLRPVQIRLQHSQYAIEKPNGELMCKKRSLLPLGGECRMILHNINNTKSNKVLEMT